MYEYRGLCQASAATQKGDLSALVSSTDTSESCDSGHHDKVPVCNQNLPEAERSVLDAVLPWPWEHLCSTHQEPDSSSGGQCPNCLSLRMHASVCQQWLGRGQSVFRQHTQDSTNVLKRQTETPAPPPHAWKGRGLCAAEG
jgi:hypothetical protein